MPRISQRDDHQPQDIEQLLQNNKCAPTSACISQGELQRYYNLHPFHCAAVPLSLCQGRAPAGHLAYRRLFSGAHYHVEFHIVGSTNAPLQPARVRGFRNPQHVFRRRTRNTTASRSVGSGKGSGRSMHGSAALPIDNCACTHQGKGALPKGAAQLQRARLPGRWFVGSAAPGIRSCTVMSSTALPATRMSPRVSSCVRCDGGSGNETSHVIADTGFERSLTWDAAFSVAPCVQPLYSIMHPVTHRRAQWPYTSISVARFNGPYPPFYELMHAGGCVRMLHHFWGSSALCHSVSDSADGFGQQMVVWGMMHPNKQLFLPYLKK